MLRLVAERGLAVDPVDDCSAGGGHWHLAHQRGLCSQPTSDAHCVCNRSGAETPLEGPDTSRLMTAQTAARLLRRTTLQLSVLAATSGRCRFQQLLQSCASIPSRHGFRPLRDKPRACMWTSGILMKPAAAAR